MAIARGALGNPWIFRETTEHLNSGGALLRPDIYEIARTMKEHLAMNIVFNGEKHGVIRFRKLFACYTRGMALKELKGMAFRAGSWDEMLRLIGKVHTSPTAGDISLVCSK